MNTSRFITTHFVRESENTSSENNSPEISGDSPTSAMAKDPKLASSKLRRGAAGKRAISVPIKDIERLRLKGDHVSAPPSDSWAWRKYGQKPIKGSPYPRGYYRCSSSKICPARKQVERSRADPNMLIVTYSCDHNHPPPSSRNIHHRPPPPVSSTTSLSEEEMEEEEEEEEDEEEEEKPRPLVRNQSQEFISDNRFSNIGEAPPLVSGGEFGWWSDFESTSSIILESPVLMEERGSTEREMAMIFSMREEEGESDLFADLGVLPECSTVFRRGMAEQRRRSLATNG